MKPSIVVALSSLLIACSAEIPSRWQSLPYPKELLSSVEKDTNEHGLYLEYVGANREQLLKQVEENLLGIGYVKVGEAFDGAVLGFSKGEDELAVKADQFGEKIFLAIFDAQGKEPLLHGVVFGRYKLGESKTGAEAKAQLLKDLGE